MSSDIQIINTRIPQEQAVKALVDNDLKLDGKIKEAKFNQNEMDQIFVDLGLDRQWKRDIKLGNDVSTFTNWAHLKAEAGYSIWKYPISDFKVNTVNNLYFDDKELDNRGEATSEAATSFDSILDYDGTTYNDQTAEAASEFGTPFDVLRDETDDVLYIGSDAVFNGLDLEFETLGLGLNISIEYSKGGDTWEVVSGLVDDTENFTRSGRIRFTLPGDFTTDTVNIVTKYWLRIKTTVAPTISPRLYFIQPLTSVVNMLSLTSAEILNEQWAWIYYNGYLYITIKNTGIPQGEGIKHINSASSQQNKQNFFVSEHEYKIEYERASFTSEPFTTSQDYRPSVVAPPTLNLTVNNGRVIYGSNFYSHNDQTITLPALSTSYVFINGSGVLASNTTGFLTRCYPICVATTDATNITNVADKRSFLNAKDDPFFRNLIGEETQPIPQIYTNSLALPGSTGEAMARPSLSTTVIDGEVRGYRENSLAQNDGFLRLSAGGGLDTVYQSYIDVSGYSTDADMNQNIVFGTGGIKRAKLNSSGFTVDGTLGVGVTSPEQKVDVEGNLRLRGSSPFIDFKMQATGNPNLILKSETIDSNKAEFQIGSTPNSGGAFVYRLKHNYDQTRVDNKFGIKADPYYLFDIMSEPSTIAFRIRNNCGIAGNYTAINISNSSSNPSSYSGELRLITTESSPNFFNPRLAFLLQNKYTHEYADIVERMTILSSGEMGIGTSTPDSLLHIKANDPNLKIEATTNSRYMIFNPANEMLKGSHALRFYVNDVATALEAMRILSGGNVGIMDTNPNYKLDVSTDKDTIGLRVKSQSILQNEYTSINISNTTGASISEYSAELRLITMASNPSPLNPRLAFLVQNAGTYLYADLVERMTILSSGEVGIGVSNPMTMNGSAGMFAGVTPKMEVSTGTSTGAYSEAVVIGHRGASSSSGTRELGFLLKLATEGSAGESSKMGGMVAYSASAYANATNLSLMTSNQKQLTVSWDGNVGIGTTGPSEKLDIDTSAADSFVRVMAGSGANKVRLGIASGKGAVVYSDTNNIYLGGINIYFTDQSLTSTRMKLTSTGLGIGIDTPTEKLHVNGSVKIGAYVLPSVDGSDEQVLKTNGLGVVAWGDLPAGTLAGLDDTVISSPADNELLAYDFGSSKWINQTRTEAGFGSLSTLNTINNNNWSGADLEIVNGGTGASSAEAARNNLGLEIDVDIQSYDVGLASIADLVTDTDKMIYTTAYDTYAVTSLSSFARTLLDDANVSTARGTLGLGTAAIKDTGTGSGNIPVLNGSGKLENSVLPALAITETYVAANETAQLALTVQKGDVCVRTDEDQTYINSTGNNTAMSDWQSLLSPDDGVLSVSAGNGMDFSTITSSGSITMGTPSTCDTGSTNALTATSHTHQISGFLPLAGGTITSNNTIKFRDSAIHIGSLNDGYLDFTADTGFRFNTGKVGIAESNPTEKLDVSGNILCKTGRIMVKNEGYDQVHYMFIGGYSPTGATNRQVNIAQVYSGSGAKQFIFLNGTLGDATTYATQTVTSSYANVFGFEASESRFNILTQSSGVNLAPIRALTVDPTGKIGIGTTSPDEILEVFGDDKTVKLTQNPVVSGGATLRITAAGVGSDANAATIIFHSAGAIWGRTDSVLKIGSTDKASTWATFRTDGKVGIGIENPLDTFHVNYELRLSSNEDNDTQKFGAIIGSQYNSAAESEGYLGLFFDSNSVENHLFIGGGLNSYNTTKYIRFYTSDDRSVRTGTEKMRITGEGRVGIGTSIPSEALGVEGNIALSGGGTPTIKTVAGNLHLAPNAGAVSLYDGVSAIKLYLYDGATARIAFNPGGDSYVKSGNFGVGTSSINEKLTVEGAVSFDEMVTPPGVSAGYGKLYVKASDGFLYYKSSAGAETNLTTASNVWSVNGPKAYYNAGDVGIGVSDPQSLLHLSSSSSTYLFIESTDGGRDSFKLGVDGLGFILYNNDDARFDFVVDGDGNIGIGNTTPEALLHIGSAVNVGYNQGPLRIATEDGEACRILLIQNGQCAYTLGMDAGNDNFYLKNESKSEIPFMIDFSGDVGIGTGSPSTRLHIKDYFEYGEAVHDTINIDYSWSGGTTSNPSSMGGITWAGGYARINAYRLNPSTNNHTALDFWTYNHSAGLLKRMTIDEEGSVGIGTASPVVKLDVRGDIGFNYGSAIINPTAAYNKVIKTGWENNYDFLALYAPGNSASSATPKVYIRNNGNVGIGTTSPGHPLEVVGNIEADSITINGVPVGTSSDTYWSANGSEIYYNGGNVGLGTTNPDYELHVYKSTASSLRARAENINSAGLVYWGTLNDTGGGCNIGVAGTAHSTHTILTGRCFVSAQASTSGLVLATESAIPIIFSLNGLLTSNEAARITSDGKWGIGISSPSTIFHIKHADYSYLTLENTNSSTGVSGVEFYNSDSNKKMAWQLQANSDLALWRHDSTAWSRAVTIKNATGRVGIGTDQPTELLHVEVATDNQYPLYVHNGTTANGIIGIGIGNDAINWGMRINGASGDNFEIRNLTTGGVSKLAVTPTGEVGIGTSSPSTRLHIYGSYGDTSTLTIEGTHAEAYNASQINLFASATSPTSIGNRIHFSDKDGSPGMIGYYHFTGGTPVDYMVFHVNSAERIRIASDGNVGIGATNPGQKLEVAGAILSQTASPWVGVWSSGTGGRKYNMISTDSSWTIGGGFLSFYDSDAGEHRLTINSSGNTGIGLDDGDPLYKLDVKDTGDDKRIIWAHGTGNGGGFINLELGSDAERVSLGLATHTANHRIWLDDNADLRLKGSAPTSDTDGRKILSENSSGRVGIGTSSPSQLLELYKSNSTAGTVLLLHNMNTTNLDVYPCEIKFQSNMAGTVTAGIKAIPNTYSNTYDFQFYTPGDSHSTKFVIKNDGKVGIGTTAPAATNGLEISKYHATTQIVLGTEESAYKTTIENNYNSGNRFGINHSGIDVLRVGQSNELTITAGWNSTGHIIFKPGGAEAIRFTGDGQVGIGTTVIDTKCIIKDSSANLLVLSHSSTSDGAGPELRFHTTTSNYESDDDHLSAMIKGKRRDSGVSGDLSFYTRSSDAISEKMCLTQEGFLDLYQNDSRLSLYGRGNFTTKRIESASNNVWYTLKAFNGSRESGLVFANLSTNGHSAIIAYSYSGKGIYWNEAVLSSTGSSPFDLQYSGNYLDIRQTSGATDVLSVTVVSGSI